MKIRRFMTTCNIRLIVRDTTTKINVINTGTVDIIRTAYYYNIRSSNYIHGPELLQLIFAVVSMPRTMCLTRCSKTAGFFLHLYIDIQY